MLRKSLLRGLAVACLLLFTVDASRADVKPHSLFTENMILQQGTKVPVWGTAGEGEKVTVACQGQTASATARDGKWQLVLENLKPGGPFTLTIEGKNKIEFKNVLVGEVWIASGQSNMQWPVSASAEPKQTIEAAKHPMIRLFTVPHTVSDKPLSEVKPSVGAKWVECSPETVPQFSAVAYAFARELHKARNVPVGVIHTSWGGTPAEAWTSKAVLSMNPALQPVLDRHEQYVKNYASLLAQYKASVEKAKAEDKKPPRPPQDPATSPHTPASLYNGMIAPLIPYAIKGAIWYQGESNAGRAYEYRTLFPAMIQNWRSDWKQGDFPFLLVQLAPFMQIVKEPQESNWAELREAQLLSTRALPNVGMAVITDVGEERDIHPKQKEPVGARLALAARAIAYGERIVYSGPEYESMNVEGNKAMLRFKHAGDGLVCKGSELTGFTVAGADRKFHNAKAEIVNGHVAVWCDAVDKPVAVRFGWANFPVVNLWNKEGLPASPFRTDDFPLTTEPRR